MLSGSGSETCLKRKFVLLKKNCLFPGRYSEIQSKILIIHGLVNVEREMNFPKLDLADIYAFISNNKVVP
jgi:hypothetical protein